MKTIHLTHPYLRGAVLTCRRPEGRRLWCVDSVTFPNGHQQEALSVLIERDLELDDHRADQPHLVSKWEG